MDTRSFLQFIALIYVSHIRKTTRNDEKLKYLTVREVMEEMESLVKRLKSIRKIENLIDGVVVKIKVHIQ